MGEKLKAISKNKYTFSISLEDDDIERTSGVIEVETNESFRTVKQKIKDAFNAFNSGNGEEYDIFGFGFDEFIEFLGKLYGLWIIKEVEFDGVFEFKG